MICINKQEAEQKRKEILKKLAEIESHPTSKDKTTDCNNDN